MPRFADHLTQVEDVLASTATNGEVRVNLGDKQTSVGWGASTPVWISDGFISRPNDPDESGACMAMHVVDGDTKRVVALRDNRFVSQVGEMKEGDRAIVSNCDARLFLKKETSAVVAYSVNQKTDESMLLEVNGSEGQIRIVNGKCAIVVSENEIVITNGKTTLSMSNDGFNVFGDHCGLNTSGGNLGSLGVVPPIVGLQSVIYGTTGISGVASSKWTIAG